MGLMIFKEESLRSFWLIFSFLFWYVMNFIRIIFCFVLNELDEDGYTGGIIGYLVSFFKLV